MGRKSKSTSGRRRADLTYKEKVESRAKSPDSKPPLHPPEEHKLGLDMSGKELMDEEPYPSEDTDMVPPQEQIEARKLKAKGMESCDELEMMPLDKDQTKPSAEPETVPPHARPPRVSPRSHPRPRPRPPVRPRRRPAPQIPPSVVIAFVEEFQKAHEVFQFRDYLRTSCPFIKQDSSSEAIFEHFLSGNLLKDKFHLADDQDIKHAIKFYMSQLEAEQAGQVVVQRKDAFTFKNPLYYLVFRAREEGYIFDKELVQELEKLQKYTPLYYHDSLVCQESPVDVEARTVTFSNFSPNLTWMSIRKYFSLCGHVENVEMQSGSEGQIAHVTFKDLSEATNALSYSGAVVPSLAKRNENGLWYAPIIVQRKSVEAASSAELALKKEDDVSSKHAEALNKYDELRRYYCDFQAKDVKVSKEEESWGGCQWMRLEALVNGGFTVGGQRVGKV